VCVGQQAWILRNLVDVDGVDRDFGLVHCSKVKPCQKGVRWSANGTRKFARAWGEQ